MEAPGASYAKAVRHRGHEHFTWAQCNELWSMEFLAPLRFDGQALTEDQKKRDRAGYLFEWLVPGFVIQWRRKTAIHGLSCHVGAPLTHALERREGWAKVMLADIQLRLETSAERDL